MTLDNLINLAARASAEGTISPVGFASLGSADYLYTYREVEPAIPEPGAWLLCLAGLAALAAIPGRALKNLRLRVAYSRRLGLKS